MPQLSTSLDNSFAAPIFTAPAPLPGQVFYTALAFEQVGTVASKNYISIFNPVASGKTVTVYDFNAIPYATAATSTTNGMNVFRVTAASGGTQVSAANIGKYATASANSIVEVRTGNPTTTNIGVALIAVPPAIATGPQGIGAAFNASPPSGAGVTLLQGEGLVANVSVGTVAQLWDVRFIWAEA